MSEFKEFDQLLKQHKDIDFVKSIEEERALKQQFVHYSNKLEGSNLTLIQTEQIINENKITTSDNAATLVDIMMAHDHYAALNQAISMGMNKYPLNEKILLSIHHTLLKKTFEVAGDYFHVISKGQKLGEFKKTNNKIKHIQGGHVEYLVPPDFEIAPKITLRAIADYYNSNEHFIEKLSKLIQSIWSAHPFFDGNKRMTRLIVANQLIANGLPFMLPHSNKNNYNDALLEGFKTKSNKPIKEVLIVAFSQQLAKDIELYKKIKKNTKPNKGFTMIL